MRPISISDDQLLACPDSQAFGDFYARHAQGVRRYFVRRTADVELAADLTSETFAAALKARDRFRPGGAPATAWLYTIAARRLIDHRRRAAGEHRMRIDLVADSDRAGLEDEHPAQLGVDPVGVGLLGRLPPDQRTAVRSHVLAGFGYAEIAEAAGTSEAAVRQRVSRGLATLRGPLRAFREAEELAGQDHPYALGGAHRTPLAAVGPRDALDCSSFASLVLKRAGLFAPEHAWVSGLLAASWGESGEGQYLTIWANDEHVWLEFRLGDRRSERFDNSPRQPGHRRHLASGTSPACDATPRHLPGM